MRSLGVLANTTWWVHLPDSGGVFALEWAELEDAVSEGRSLCVVSEAKPPDAHEVTKEACEVQRFLEDRFRDK